MIKYNKNTVKQHTKGQNPKYFHIKGDVYFSMLILKTPILFSIHNFDRSVTCPLL